MSEPRIDVTDEGRVRIVRMANEAKRNALTRPMLDELARVFTDVGPVDGEGPRAFVLTGAEAGQAFSAGFDVTQIDEGERARGLDPIQPAADAITDCPVPVVAAVDGPVFGGAVELLTACHVRIGGPAAKLGMPPAKLGLVYSTSGLRRFVQALPPSQVLKLFLSGEPVTGGEALGVGLLDELASPALVRAQSLAEAMAHNAPLAVRGTLDAVRRLTRARFAGLTDEDRAAIDEGRARSLGSADLGEGVAAMLERRAPRFEGK